MNTEKFFQRIGYKGKLEDVSFDICQNFKLGDFVSNKLVTVGYEDFNYVLKTTRSSYFVKIFANFRTEKDCSGIIDIMSKVIDQGVAVPKLLKSKQGYLYEVKINNTKLRLCVMEYVDGEDFLRSKQKVNPNEIKFITRQAALINSLKIKPKSIYDSWAIINFAKEFRKKGKYLKPGDLKIVAPLMKEFKKLQIEKLPHCFIHGDIIKPNVMKDKHGKIWIIDFSVSGYYPRVQELAVLTCNLFFDEDSKSKSEENLKLALKEYQKKIKLTARELEALPVYIKLAHAMHILLANYQKIVEKNNSKENEYFFRQGKLGLKQG
ncbi:MAG: phosphotransferase [Parcubacteria group bacterium]|jgi:Ser/Thr protein kinase RdoA (MazF antagonist)